MARVSAEPIGLEWGGGLVETKQNWWNILWALTQGCFWKQKANHQTARFGTKIHVNNQCLQDCSEEWEQSYNSLTKWNTKDHYIVHTQIMHWSWIVQRSLISVFTEEHRGWVWHNMVRTGQHRLNSCGSGLKQAAGSCEHSSEHLRSIKCREFIDQLRNY